MIMKSSRCIIPSLSRLLVGSSRRRISGSWISAAARSRRACCQPENEETILSSGALRLTTSSISQIFLSIL